MIILIGRDRDREKQRQTEREREREREQFTWGGERAIVGDGHAGLVLKLLKLNGCR